MSSPRRWSRVAPRANSEYQIKIDLISERLRRTKAALGQIQQECRSALRHDAAGKTRSEMELRKHIESIEGIAELILEAERKQF
jgi:hypothetical protein